VFLKDHCIHVSLKSLCIHVSMKNLCEWVLEVIVHPCVLEGPHALEETIQMTAWVSTISTSVKLWCIYTSIKGHHIQGTMLPRTFEAFLFSRVVKESPHSRASDGLLGVRATEEPLHPRATGRPSYYRALQVPLYSIYTPLKGRCVHTPLKGRCIHLH